ncbi:MAG: glycosyltransferase family protein [Clostridiaceae bacterium]
MNNDISFIICVNDREIFNEARKYIENLYLPKGIEFKIYPIENASSMTSGYNTGMKIGDSKYKVYMHQDVFIINKNFINDIIKIFDMDEKIGMIGMVGSRTISQNGMWWESGNNIGYVYDNSRGIMRYNLWGNIEAPFKEAKMVDGLMIITQYDIEWREDIFNGWHFYDVSQCMEFIRHGYKIVIPHQITPWCLHDCYKVGDWNDYNYHRMNFLKEYSDLI